MSNNFFEIKNVDFKIGNKVKVKNVSFSIENEGDIIWDPQVLAKRQF